MSIQFLAAYYHPFLEGFIKRNPEIETLSYKQCLELLLGEYFADTGATYAHFLQRGDDADIIICNFELLQKKWAKENNCTFSEKNWQHEIAAAQVKKYNPDVFFIESIFSMYGNFILDVKPFVKKKIAAWISTPFSENLNLKGIDIFFSSTPDFVTYFKQKGADAEYLLPAFDERVLDKLKIPKKKYNFSFVGGWSDVHVKRKEALLELAKKTPIKIWGYGYKNEVPLISKQYLKEIFFNDMRPVLRAYQCEAWGIQMYQVLADSLVTFNIHESLLNGNVGNMRMFEATGVGTLLLNDEGNNLSVLFEKGKEIETYKNINEAIEKVKYYRKNPEKAIEMGRNAQARTLKDYNYKIFTQKLASALFRKL